MNVLGITGIVVWHLQGPSRPNERLFTQIGFFLAMTAALVFARIMPFRFDAPHLDETGSLIVTAKILWWTHLSWATIGFVRIYIVLDGRPREARLIQDLLVAIIYLGVLLSVMAFVFGSRSERFSPPLAFLPSFSVLRCRTPLVMFSPASPSLWEGLTQSATGYCFQTKPRGGWLLATGGRHTFLQVPTI